MNDFKYTDERFADLQMLRYEVPGFDKLTLKQRRFVYFLSEATLCGRDILWDQNGRYNLRIRAVLESIYKHYKGDRTTKEFKAFAVYLKRVWFSNGIHHHYGCEKFTPDFSANYLQSVLEMIPADKLPESLDSIQKELFPVIFDPKVMPKRVNQAKGEDLLQTSACNYYAPEVTQKMAEDYYSQKKKPNDPHPIMYGMNSRLELKDGKLVENVWKSGGMYGPAIDKIIGWLGLARKEAENKQQQKVIDTLIEFYRTGDLHTFDQYTIEWVKCNDGNIDFTNGFTEVYGDPLGLKASWEGYVNFKDYIATERAEKLSQNAQWFEDHSPVDPRFKKEECRGVSAKVIIAAMLGGDLYPSSAIGINLPNSNWVRQEHGSKSVTIGNLTHAYNEAAKGNGFREEFVIDEKTRKLLDEYEDTCDHLHTDLHECLGHGSGKLLPGIDPDALKAYGCTIEEARADLFGLYYLADRKLMELGLMPNMEAWKSHYYSYMMNGLMTQLVRIEPGHQIEEAHMRNRALIAHWCLEKGKDAMQILKRQGKSYLKINDYSTLHKLVGQLLAEIQRIKSEGDFAAAQYLIETYAVKVDVKLHTEILERYKTLNLAPYKGFINPQYIVTRNDAGEISNVEIKYGEPYDQQMLRYSREYRMKR